MTGQGEYQSGQMGQTVNLLAYAFGGSNPSSPTQFAEVAQSIEHQPSKLRVAGLSPVFRSRYRVFHLCGERLFYFVDFRNCVMAGCQKIIVGVKQKRGKIITIYFLSFSLLCGMDGTRTRDPLRDRQVF